MTIYELRDKLNYLVNRGCGDWELKIDGLSIEHDCFCYGDYDKKIDIRPHHYKSPQYEATQKLQGNIKKAIDSYFKEIWRKEDEMRELR